MLDILTKMADAQTLKDLVSNSFNFTGTNIVLDSSKLGEEILADSLVKIPLKTFNRHGLIAAATVTGKTKTLQNIAEKLSTNGVSTLLMDIKGDLSGILQAGTTNPKIEERHQKVGLEWKALLKYYLKK